MAHPDIRLTTYEKVQQLWLLPIILLKAILSTIAAVLTDRTTHHLRRTFGVSFLHHATRTLSFRQQLAPDVPTGATIAAYCASHRLAHTTLPVPVPPPPRDTASAFHAAAIPPATLHLITVPGPSSPDHPTPDSGTNPPPPPPPPPHPNRTLLYLHGGGYARPLNGLAQLPFALRCAAAARAPTLAVLEYGLAPRLRYPAQLAQSGAALRVVLGALAAPPEEVVLMGDSAGGNAVLGVLAWAREGRGPGGRGGRGELGLDAAGGGRVTRRLRAAVAVSPWCGVSTGRASYERNERWDFLGREGMAEFQEAVRLAEGEVWADMLGAAEEDGERWGERFWRGVVEGEGRVVERALLTVGTREVFLDDVTEMARLMGAGDGEGNVRFVKCKNEVHVGAVVDQAMGIEDGEMLQAVLAFLKDL